MIEKIIDFVFIKPQKHAVVANKAMPLEEILEKTDEIRKHYSEPLKKYFTYIKTKDSLQGRLLNHCLSFLTYLQPQQTNSQTMILYGPTGSKRKTTIIGSAFAHAKFTKKNFLIHWLPMDSLEREFLFELVTRMVHKSMS